MSELPEGVTPGTVPAPRDSASAIVVRPASGGGWEVLLGLRSARSRFMPGHHSFPGGGLEPADRPGQTGEYERCASRELVEEMGLHVAPEDWTAVGERTTPPMFAVRFRTRFFLTRLGSGEPAAGVTPASAENERARFVAPSEILRDWEAGTARLPPPILPILRALDGTRSFAELAPRITSANALEERAPRIEFAPDVWMLPLHTATLPPATHTNAWIPGGRSFVVVDPGADAGAEIERLLAVVARRRELGHRPVAVVLTHHHRDHVAGAAPVARALEVPVLAHPATLSALATDLGSAERSPLADLQTIDLDGMTLRAVHTPGHAAGHLALELIEPRVVIIGDLASGLSTILIDPDGGDMTDYLDSLERLARIETRLLLPGHGPPLSPRRVPKLIEHRRARERRIVEALASGVETLDGLAQAAYADTPGLPAPLRERQTRSHLIRLEREGRAARRGGTPPRWHPAGGAAGGNAARIASLLRERFRPRRFELIDDSARHVGHAGATSGGGHFKVVIVAGAFEGKSRLEQHRMVNEALADLFGREIHALALTTRAPSEDEG